MSKREWDAFISYASEDRESVVDPWFKLLSAVGVRVWYDQERLRVGQGLREEIDNGLARCDYGIVILSPAFLPKHYPNRELDGLLQREVEGEQVLLPVWHDVDAAGIRKFSLPLAGRVATRTREGILVVAERLLKVLRPSLEEELRAAAEEYEFVHLPEVSTGSRLVAVVAGACGYNFGHDEIGDEEDVELVSGFLGNLQDWGDIWTDLDIRQRVQAEHDLGESLAVLRDHGWKVFGKQVRQVPTGYPTDEKWPIASVVVARDAATSVAVAADGRFVVGVQPGDTEQEPVETRGA